MMFKVHIQFVLISILVLASYFRPGVSKPLEPFGYISVDCGGTGGADPITGLHWDTDEDYLQSAALLKSEGFAVSSEVNFSNSTAKFRVNAKQSDTAMVLFFPHLQTNDILKYCYSFNLSLSNMQSKHYLVRVVFSNSNLPSVVGEEFDYVSLFAVDATIISEITLDDHEAQTVELFATALDDILDICFLPADDIYGTTLVAISSLEVRSVPETLFPTYTGGKLDSDGRPVRPHPFVYYYLTVSRLNFGGDESSPPIRYPFDRYDRLWYGAPVENSTWYKDGELVPVMTDTGSKIKSKSMNSSAVVSNGRPENDWFQVPPAVLASAWEGATDNATISFTLDMTWWSSDAALGHPSLYYCLGLALFDVDPDKNNSGSRSVDINNTDSAGASQWIASDAKVLETGTYIWSDRTYVIKEAWTPRSTFNIRPAAESTRAAMVNSLELYAVIENSKFKTDFDDGDTRSL